MKLIPAVRLEIGDQNPEKGILPSGRQFTDDEIVYAAASESITELDTPTQRQIGRTAARLLQIASTQWASQPEEVELGPSAERGKQSQTLGRKASELRAIWGFGNITPGDRTKGSTPAYSSSGGYILPPGVP
jgi:hypothetical protein